MDADPTGTSIISSLLLLLFFTLMNGLLCRGRDGCGIGKQKPHPQSGRGWQQKSEGHREAFRRFDEVSLDDPGGHHLCRLLFIGICRRAHCAGAGAWLASRGLPYAEAIASNGVTLLLMFFNLVFGELVPKRIALQKAEAFCMLTVMPVHYISIVLSPFIKLLSVSTKVVLKLLGFKTTDQEEAVTEEEIKALLKQGSETGLFEDEERKMIDSVFAFTTALRARSACRGAMS